MTYCSPTGTAVDGAPSAAKATILATPPYAIGGVSIIARSLTVKSLAKLSPAKLA